MGMAAYYDAKEVHLRISIYMHGNQQAFELLWTGKDGLVAKALMDSFLEYEPDAFAQYYAPDDLESSKGADASTYGAAANGNTTIVTPTNRNKKKKNKKRISD